MTASKAIVTLMLLTSCARAKFTHTQPDKEKPEPIIIEVEKPVKKNYCYYDPYIDCDVCERFYYIEYYCYYY
jgi:hypothetical protein